MEQTSRRRTATAADLAVTVVGVAGFLGFLLLGRMDSPNASPFDIVAFCWFLVFGVIRQCLPWLRSRRRR